MEIVLNLESVLILYGTTVLVNLILLMARDLTKINMYLLMLDVLLGPFTILYNFGWTLHAVMIAKLEREKRVYVDRITQKYFVLGSEELNNLFLNALASLSKDPKVDLSAMDYDFFMAILTDWELSGIVIRKTYRRHTNFSLAENGVVKLIIWKEQL